jgi:TolB-like protein/DNA-binding winged helix-turn-helix (wHTH) protein/cytochrome c-type biogenesis protein CcmH/NrfG
MNAPGPRCYAFERFHFDPLRGRLTNGGAAIELRPKSLAVLHYLVTHPQRLVEKDELLAAVWGKVVVTEDSLVQCVREIRQALGDADQRIIRTIPRSGYMFVAEVVDEPPAPLGEASVPSTTARRGWAPRSDVGRWLRRRWLAAGTVAALVATALVWLAFTRTGDDGAGTTARRASLFAPRLSIIVLPLVNIGGDPEQEYFADGLTNDLTTDLGRVPTSLVISHNSARAYRGNQVDSRQLGRELGVRYVLEGSVQRLRDDVRVNLRLIETDGGAQRWAERFEGPRAGLAEMQANIVRQIAQTLEIRMLEAEADRSARERTRDPDAQDLLMRGWALWEHRNPADNAKARELFVQALVEDPNFSLAWVGVANTHLSDLHSGWSDDRQGSLREAERAMNRAYAIGPRHRDVNAGRGYVLFFRGDIELALAAFDEEIGTNPSNPLAHVWRGLMLISLARPAEALPAIERGIMLSPRDVDLNVFYRSMAHANFSLGRYEQAVSWSQKAVGHTPTYAKGYAFLAAAAALNGDSAAAASALESVHRLQPKYVSIETFKQSLMPGEARMFDATPRFWEALQRAGQPLT